MVRSAHIGIRVRVKKPRDEVYCLDVGVENPLRKMIDIDSHASKPAKKPSKKCPSSH